MEGLFFDPRFISIHAPPRGATRFVSPTRWGWKFQFTPLREGRRALGGAVDFGGDFNSRPSARGDAHQHLMNSKHSSFQFTPLREGRRKRWDSYAAGDDFNSRPSARGDPMHRVCRNPPIFQFTPLREGRQFPPRPHPPLRQNFNSRPSARGDPANHQR